MPTALPASSDFTGAGVTEGDFKAAISALRDFLSGLIGADGAPVTALATLGAPASGSRPTTALVLVPTRELAAQVGEVLQGLARELPSRPKVAVAHTATGLT